MKAIAFARTTEMNLLARVAKVTTSGNTILVKWDNYTDVEFKLVNDLLKIEKVRVNFDTVYASIFGTKWDQFKDKHRTHIGAALITLGAGEFVIRTDFVIGLLDQVDVVREESVIRNATDLASAQRRAISGIARNTEERIARERADSRDALIQSAGTLLGLGLAAIMSRR